MCGIAGGWWKNANEADAVLPQALAELRHRGPNDQGFDLFPCNSAVLALGHTRLSIIDLSDAGHQPMHSRDGRWSIVFNGEIYNYRELRDELRTLGHHFTSDSDTEVLLTAWAQWQQACLPRLAGMFAFVVFDHQSSTLSCVRDAFGIKPFFYASNQEGFRFASELRALLKLLPGKPELNWQTAYDYLVHAEYDRTPETFFKGIQHLPPAHWMQVDLQTGQASSPRQWWMPEVKERPGWRFEHAVEQVREQFLANIRLHLRSDVPLGAALSGGIDSSAVVSAMRHVEPDLPINTFSFIAAGDPNSEEHWVDRINEHVGAKPHKLIVSPDELAHDLDDMIRAQGEPFGSTSIYAQYRIFRLAQENGITVMLEGQGADEMLAGYSGYPGQRLHSLLESGQWVKAARFLNAWSQWPGRSRGLGLKHLAGQMSTGALYDFFRSRHGRQAVPSWLDGAALAEHGVLQRFPKHPPRITHRGRRVIAELAASLSERGLTHLLRHGDRNSMRFSIESRVPFLTLDLVNLLLSMPEDYLISQDGQTKHVFRAAMRGIVPDDVLDRKDKIGFATPERQWLSAISDTVREWFRTADDVPLLNLQQVEREFELTLTGEKPFSWQVWRWINFIRWHRQFFQ